MGVPHATLPLYCQAVLWLTGVLQQSSDEHVAVKLLALSAALLPVILLSGLLYRLASGASLSTALYKMYCLLYRIETGKEPNVASYLVTNAVFVLGFFTLALLLGVVNDEVQRRADDARMGRNPLYCKDHVLLLNWNKNSPALLRNIATAISTAPAAAAAAAAGGGAAGSLWARGPTVVVLADTDKAVMDAAVQEAVRERGLRLNVHTREGSPFKPSHLRKVSAADASVVILLHPDGAGSPEALKAAAAMSLSTLKPAGSSVAGSGSSSSSGAKHSQQQRVIVQMPKSVPAGGNVLQSLLAQQSPADGLATTTAPAAAPPAAAAGASRQLQLEVLQMPDDALVNRIVAQTAAQPGVLSCWQDIIAPDAGSSHFCTVPLPQQLQQMTYRELRRLFQQGVVCGFIDSEGSLALNPQEGAVPGPGSRLVQLTRRGPATHSTAAEGVFAAAAEAAAQRLRSGTSYKAKLRSIIVAGWPERDVPELVRRLAEFMPHGSTVTFVSQQLQPAALGKLQCSSSSCSFKWVTHPYPMSKEALLAAGLQGAGSVVLGTCAVAPAPAAAAAAVAAGAGSSQAELSDSEADARVLAALLQVQDAVLDSQLPAAPHIVAPIREHGSSSIALNKGSRVNNSSSSSSAGSGDAGSAGSAAVVKPEFLVFRDVTSAVLAQVVAEPAYSGIIAELLFSHEGHELYLRSPASFNIPLGVPISFAEVAELARLTGQTALGYLDTDNSDLSSSSSSSGEVGAQLGGASSLASAAASVYLGLDAADSIVFTAGDWIVVLAEEY
ncbi:hypothetical protein OEZ86_006620 [Tetradesmus obliquus]|nr:hypothetical protein OEZ86_006620 [Tetradesmus obliquus]